jgi:DNA-binding transcriptional LysR family regulator
MNKDVAMDRLTCMESFTRIVERGSFSVVAHEMGVTQPTVSKQIHALETHLGVRLFNRSTRSLSLTDDGTRYYERCRAALEVVDDAEASVRQGATPSGLLRVSCPIAFGVIHIAPRIKGFLDRYPNIKVNFLMSDLFVDLVEEGADVAVRIGELSDSALIARRIGDSRRIVTASPSYLRANGRPESPADLGHHDCIQFTGLSAMSRWHFDGPDGPEVVDVNGRLRASNATAVREAVVTGAGISLLPAWLIEHELACGVLEPVLTDYSPRSLPVNILYPPGRHQPAKVRCFIDYFAGAFEGASWLV